MIKGTKEIVTVRLSAKDLKNHREEVKDVMIKHKNHIMFLGVGRQTMKLFADSVAREVGYVIGYWNVAPKAVSRVTNELLESKGFKVTEDIVIGEVGKAKPRVKVAVVSYDDETAECYYYSEYANASQILKDSYICYYNSNKDHKKAIEDGLKAKGIHYSKVYYSNHRWFIQWRGNKTRWAIAY